MIELARRLNQVTAACAPRPLTRCPRCQIRDSTAQHRARASVRSDEADVWEGVAALGRVVGQDDLDPAAREAREGDAQAVRGRPRREPRGSASARLATSMPCASRGNATVALASTPHAPPPARSAGAACERVGLGACVRVP